MKLLKESQMFGGHVNLVTGASVAGSVGFVASVCAVYFPPPLGISHTKGALKTHVRRKLKIE